MKNLFPIQFLMLSVQNLISHNIKQISFHYDCDLCIRTPDGIKNTMASISNSSTHQPEKKSFLGLFFHFQRMF